PCACGCRRPGPSCRRRRCGWRSSRVGVPCAAVYRAPQPRPVRRPDAVAGIPAGLQSTGSTENAMNHPRGFPGALKRPLPDALVASLRARFGERLSTANAVREQHGRDESPFPVMPPDAVVFARSTDEVADAVRQCRAHKVPVIPFGVGSSLEGHLLAVQGGVSIDVSQMNRVLAVNAEDLTVTVQAGV